MEKTAEINEEISFREVLVIDSNGEKLGVMSRDFAIIKAKSEGLDLVLVSSNGTPVCKIMDYSKFKFQQKKKEKEIKKNQKIIENAEVQMTLTTQVHDIETKISTTKRLIRKGNNVTVILKLRGREINQIETALNKMNQFANSCSSFAKIKRAPALDGGRDVKMLLEKI